MKKILIINDSPTSTLLLKSKIGNSYKIEQAITPLEASEKFTKNTDLIISDLMIRDTNALDIIKGFKEKGFKGKVIFLTNSMITQDLISEFNKVNAINIDKSQSTDYLASEINKMFG